ncbi:hypothetical protein, partial [Streptococcus pneumoniae]|uniref:hypothetical protein n=1 Tax=Streptococcus pneumoniae TaxID=1313 RepID=UPI001CD5CB46
MPAGWDLLPLSKPIILPMTTDKTILTTISIFDNPRLVAVMIISGSVNEYNTIKISGSMKTVNNPYAT